MCECASSLACRLQFVYTATARERNAFVVGYWVAELNNQPLISYRLAHQSCRPNQFILTSYNYFTFRMEITA